MLKYLLFLLIIPPGTLFPQNYHIEYSFGNFKDASAFYMSSSGFLYVTDSGKDELYKLDTLGNIVKDCGGYGWDEGAFDNPVDVFATPLNVYVCDKNNNRIQRFDKDLNFISQLNTHDSGNKNERFGYPASCATSNLGDMFILDTDNKRVLKFDLFGNFIMNFGGFDAGIYSLSNPKMFSISPSNFLFVLDGKKIIVFDQYGNGISIFNSDYELESINIIFNKMTVNTKSNILFADLNNEFSLNEIILKELEEETDIVSSLIFNNKLYVLTPEKIIVYDRTGS
jgi:DNA-binding beta-propeller fold protein YncE